MLWLFVSGPRQPQPKGELRTRYQVHGPPNLESIHLHPLPGISMFSLTYDDYLTLLTCLVIFIRYLWNFWERQTLLFIPDPILNHLLNPGYLF